VSLKTSPVVIGLIVLLDEFIPRSGKIIKDNRLADLREVAEGCGSDKFEGGAVVMARFDNGGTSGVGTIFGSCAVVFLHERFHDGGQAQGGESDTAKRAERALEEFDLIEIHQGLVD